MVHWKEDLLYNKYPTLILFIYICTIGLGILCLPFEDVPFTIKGAAEPGDKFENAEKQKEQSLRLLFLISYMNTTTFATNVCLVVLVFMSLYKIFSFC